MAFRTLFPVLLLLVAARPVAATEWQIVRAGLFEVITDTGPKRATALADLLVRTRVGLDAATDLDVSMTQPLRVFVFRERSGFERVAARFVGNRPTKSGISIIHDDVKMILMDGSTLFSDELLRHELVHHFAWQTYGLQPLWLTEGLAELYANLDVRARYVDVARPRQQHLVTIRGMKAVPLRELLAADETTRWYSGRLEQRRFYSHAWLLTHYLMMNRPDDLRRFTTLLRDRPLDDAFRETFGVTYEQLQRDVLRYARRIMPTRRVPLNASVALDVPASPRLLTEEELQAHLAAIDAQTLDVVPLSMTFADPSAPDRLTRYDAAVAKVAAGELAAAVTMLEELLKDVPEGELRRNARELLEQVRQQIRRNR